MFHFLKADLYRIFKERLGLVTILILLFISGVVGYAFKDIPSSEVISSMMTILAMFMPLFFVTPGKIFFGEDIVQRTINNSLIKIQSRPKTFLYRLVMSVLSSLFYVVLSYVFAAIVYQILSGQMILVELLKVFLYQLPYYLTFATLPLVFFTLFDKLYKTNTLYIITFMMYETVLSLIFGMLLKVDSSVYEPYFFASRLSQTVAAKGAFFTQSSIAALIFAVAFSGLSYVLFSRREFK